MKIRSVILVSASLLFLPNGWSRTWINSEGKKIEAEFLSSNGTHVTLQMGTRKLEYQISKLSKNDQEWIASKKDKSGKAPATELTGIRKGLSISKRLFPETKDYFKEKTRKSVLTAFEGGAFNKADKGGPDEWFSRNLESDTMTVYVPQSYDGSEPYGLYLHISPTDNSMIPAEWHPLFDELKIIAVSADKTSNNEAMPRRVMLSVDAIATIQETYKIDPKRRVSGGLSGGGHMAMLTAAMFPELFTGAVSHAAQSYLPKQGGTGHFPGMSARDFKRSDRGDLKWVVVSGEKDFNYQEILDSSEVWKSNRLNYRFIDAKGMAHSNAKRKDLQEALNWIGL